MADLPIFLNWIRGNALLYSIITTGSFSNIDLKSIDHVAVSERTIELRNFALSETEVFESVFINLTDRGTTIRFMTAKPDYFDSTKYYFGYEILSTKNSSYQIDGKPLSTERKILDEYYLFPSVPVVSTNLYNSSIYGYMILIDFDKDAKKSTRTIFVNGYKTSLDIIRLLKPKEVKITSKYSFTSYEPESRITLRKNHPVLKYFENKSSLFYEGKMYEHNNVPRVRPSMVGKIVFHSNKGKPAFLEIIPSKEETEEKNISYTNSKSPDIKYYCVDSVMITKEEVKAKKIKLKRDFDLSENVFGKKAFEMFGDPKYADGVSVYRHKQLDK
jgi:hypothetical protein